MRAVLWFGGYFFCLFWLAGGFLDFGLVWFFIF